MFHSVVCVAKSCDTVLSNAALHYVANASNLVLSNSRKDAEHVLRAMVQENFGPTLDLLFTDPSGTPCDVATAPAIKIHIVDNTMLLQ